MSMLRTLLVSPDFPFVAAVIALFTIEIASELGWLKFPGH